MKQSMIIKIQNNTLLFLLIIVLFESLFILVSFLELNSYKFVKTCSEFSSQKDAQKALNKYPKKYRRLDKNKDGIACNALQ